MKKYILGSSIVTLLIVTLSISYYFLVILPTQTQAQINLEKQKFEAEQKEKNDKRIAELSKANEEERKKKEKKASLDSCLLDADYYYNNLWNTGCEAWKIEVDTAWKNCRSSTYSFEDDAQNKQRCVKTTPDYKVDNNGMCLLPNARIKTIDERVSASKDECYRQFNLE